ncbi:MAG: phosphoribosylglycinamide formyltransferase [Lachnospiraceae bacterium]|nr:phosphoribosylglycinamide formyltransferase [Lachnospiraceae bacterium]
MFKIGVLVSGGGTNLQAIIDEINCGKLPGVEIATVVSSKKDAYALERAENAGINGTYIEKKAYESSAKYEKALIKHFQSFDVELIVLAGFLVVLGETFINAYENRIINIHPALIPSFCGDGFYGLKVHEAVLEKGVKVTGATVHFVTKETDAGPIILQKAVYINEDDDAKSLQRRVMEEAEWVILPEAIRLIAGGKIKITGNIVRRV